MAFDISTAKPVSGGFDISTAKPEQQAPQEVPSGRFAVGGRAFRDPFASRLGPAQEERKQQEQLLTQIRETAPQGAAFARDLPEIGEAPELRQMNVPSAKSGFAAGLITNEAELATALRELNPGSEIKQDPEGQLTIQFPSGGEYAINKPGLSGQDFTQFATRLLSFIPAGRIVGGGAKQLAKGAAAAGVTEAGLQAGEAAVGGEFDPEQVGVAAAIQPAAQVAGVGLSKLKQLSNAEISTSAREVIEEGERRGVDVLTSDLFPPESAWSKSLRQISEKLGPLGTGSTRAKQQQARVDAVQAVADDLGLSVENTPQINQIFESLNKGIAERLTKAAQMRGEAIFRLTPMGTPKIGNVQETIGRQIAAQRALKEKADKSIINEFEKLSRSLRGANFRQLANQRANLIADIKAAERGEGLPSKAVRQMQAVKASIDSAMENFAKQSGDRGAAALWKQSNRLNFETLNTAKESALKKIANNKNAKPEDVIPLIKGGKTSDLKRLSNVLDESGNKSVRAAIIRDALEEARFFKVDGGSPDSLINALEKGPRQRAINVFFSGSDKKQLEGLVKLLSATRRAQQASAGTTTGLAELTPLAATAGVTGAAFADGMTGFLLGSSVVGAAKGYESKAVRNLLLRISAAKAGSNAERAAIEEALPVITPILQGSR